MIVPGNNVRLSTRDSREFEGTILPDTNNEKIVIKLQSGYNIGIKKTKIESIKQLPKQMKKAIKKEKIKYNKNLPTVSIIHTGGTIASEVDYDSGAVIARFTPEELMGMFPELKKIANINSFLLSNMWSEDMRFSHYNLMAKAVKKEADKGADGVIITHGTDTMAYTAAALSFALEGLNIPVLIVGAQRSSDRGSSDAFMNLLCAVNYIAKSNFCDVGICLHETSDDKSCLILPATKTKKTHTSRRDAFRPFNAEPIARVYPDGRYENISKHATRQDKKDSKIKVKPFRENIKVAILKAHPNLYATELDNYSKFDGLIIEGTGLGHIAINEIDKHTGENKKIYNSVKSLAKKMPVFMTSQCNNGRINMNVYSTGRKIKESGVIGDHNDMLTETAFIKMAWLLSNYPKPMVHKLMMENLRGEISPRSLEKEFHFFNNNQ
ncbi:MAG: Glu-tRNA(Gln) amidotransferase subunit GatD [Nanoarchaeota archaeon]|nr:Glu-tRNA(Gln) amidotransferase subunit GatD [Nanoarchaeota archaeon]